MISLRSVNALARISQHYERGRQTLPPEMARRVIAFAASRGVAIDFNHIYGAAVAPDSEADEAAAANAF